ncbi:cytoplasmic dynein 1 light intermediate chain 2 [Folsomia candida]|uniref:Dynein light intermediate chain n=1 Tax=Folsomia candida TaxID=158441 RepID=A0A226F1E1_FOLCA|nr:cytoplasmic dynein 1 light intermediate chain 2 [Folsomia candida]OXA63582.1 Cytoplasmic dynein 1 light intermediate chain 2 [Folsomia candida]
MGSASAENVYKQQNNNSAGSAGSGSEDNVWSSILSEVRSNASVKLPSGRAVVVLGHPESGKTTLVAKLQGIEDPKKGSGLEYTYIEIRDEYREDTTHLSVFTLDGDKAHFPLLTFALNTSTLTSTTILLTVSMSTPWLILEQLQDWAGLLHDHVDSLKIPPDEVKTLREGVLRRWLSYQEPLGDGEGDISGLVQGGGVGIEEMVADEGVLVRNVGVDIVVVVTKTDHMTTLEREENYREEHFDFIQFHVRRFCLNYGASLFYTSVKEDKNCDLLYKYLVHRVYGGTNNFKTPALVVEKDAVFIPSGWDNLKKMSILHESMSSIDPESYYNDVILRPVHKTVRSEGRNVAEVEVEDEQLFLERQMGILTLGGGGGAVGGSVGKGKTPASDKRQTSGGGGSSISGGVTTGGITTPKKGEQCTDRVLANFFNSLLTNKKSGGGGGSGPSSANTSLSGTDC